MRTKHRNDHNHGKNGWVGGNPRYSGKATSNQRGNFRPKRRRASSQRVLRTEQQDLNRE